MNAKSPISVTLSGSSMEKMDLQPDNMPSEIMVKMQLANALFAMLSMPSWRRSGVERAIEDTILNPPSELGK